MQPFARLPFMESAYFSQELVRDLLVDGAIKNIRIFALGPKGTNIDQASQQWCEKVGITDKSSVTLTDTPEQSLASARLIREDGQFPVFVTCAVYYRLNEMFFGNPDCYVFMDYLAMKLDGMQLATRRQNDDLPDARHTIITHPSPSVLVSDLSDHIIYANSNAEAAMQCRSGKADFCVTTEQARRLSGLKTVFNFGSATMIFFFGTTAHGVKMLHRLAGHGMHAYGAQQAG